SNRSARKPSPRKPMRHTLRAGWASPTPIARSTASAASSARDRTSAAALVHELLRALSGIDLGRVDVTFGVDREVVDPVELAGAPAVAPEAAEHTPGVA